MEKTIKDHMEDTFEDLTEGDLKKFKNKLRDRNEEPRVREGDIRKVQDAQDLATLMVNTFTVEGALTVTLEMLEFIKCNGQAAELRKKTGRVTPVVPQPGSSAPSAEHFIDRNWKTLIERVSSVDAILDDLLQKKVITYDDCSKIRAKTTPQDMMRELQRPIISAGRKGKDILYQALMETNRFLMEDLGAK